MLDAHSKKCISHLVYDDASYRARLRSMLQKEPSSGDGSKHFPLDDSFHNTLLNHTPQTPLDHKRLVHPMKRKLCLAISNSRIEH